MISINNLTNTRKAFREAGIDNYLFNITDIQREQIKIIVLEIYLDIQEHWELLDIKGLFHGMMIWMLG